ncbi:MAG: hypothetical protein U0Q03_09265 [Acidimicrobiales bacterium]
MGRRIFRLDADHVFAAALVAVVCWQTAPLVSDAVASILPGTTPSVGAPVEPAAPEVASEAPVPGSDGDDDAPLTPAGLTPLVVDPAAPTPPVAGADECRTELTSDALDAQLRTGAGMVSGGDYPHAYPLADGRIVWLFQDVFVGSRESLDPARFAHNGGFVQDGLCTSPLPGATPGRSWIGGDREDTMMHWFWPLDGAVGADGQLFVFVAEMYNLNGTGAAEGALPVATWLAVFDGATLELRSFTEAPDSSTHLFGYSIANDERYSYLYGNCYRQFAPADAGVSLGMDRCSASTVVARVPRGEFAATPEYFTMQGWSSDGSSPIAVMSGGISHATSVRHLGTTWVAVTKQDEWFGDHLVVETADRPEGPWRVTSLVPVESLCATCASYGALVLPWVDDGDVVVVLSSNDWTAERASQHPGLYRPFVVRIGSDSATG